MVSPSNHSSARFLRQAQDERVIKLLNLIFRVFLNFKVIMRPEIVHLYGPLSINAFGIMIIIGLIIFSTLILKDPRRSEIMSTDQYFNLLTLSIIISFLGARILFVLINWNELQSWVDILHYGMEAFLYWAELLH